MRPRTARTIVYILMFTGIAAIMAGAAVLGMDEEEPGIVLIAAGVALFIASVILYFSKVRCPRCCRCSSAAYDIARTAVRIPISGNLSAEILQFPI